MSFAYYLIDHIKYNGYDMYYKKPIDTTRQKAKGVFDDKHIYYYKSPYHAEEPMKKLGKFTGKSKRSSTTRAYDYDYDVYEFTEVDHISCSEIDNIYREGIPETNDSRMIRIIDIDWYNEYPVYYEEF